MPHKPDSQGNLSIKTKLFLIVIMFVAINLIFYVGFGSSDESEKPSELNDKIQVNIEKNTEIKQELTSSTTP